MADLPSLTPLVYASASYWCFTHIVVICLPVQETEEAIHLANTALTIKSDSYEAYYARARAKREAK